MQVPGGLALSDCRGYEDWADVAVSHENKIKVIVANSVSLPGRLPGRPSETVPASERPIEIPFLVDVPSGSQPHDVFGANRSLRGGCLILDRRRRPR